MRLFGKPIAAGDVTADRTAPRMTATIGHIDL